MKNVFFLIFNEKFCKKNELKNRFKTNKSDELYTI